MAPRLLGQVTSWRWVRRTMPGLLMVLAVAVTMTSCSGGHPVISGPSTRHKVEPSVGCGHGAPKNITLTGGEQSQSLKTGTTSGTFDLSVPRTYRPHHPSPLILAFYGFGSDPAQFAALTTLPARGSTDGYLVVVPHTQGSESEWQLNAHGADATFVDDVVNDVETTYCIDRGSVFAAGFSAGAAFTVIYSCARQPRVTAIATVAVEFQLGCVRPMSILAFHGTADPLVPYRNGAIGLSLPGIKVRGTQRNMGDWARLDTCRVAARRRSIGSQVVLQQWEGCRRGTAVALYTVVGGGHSWPGADPRDAIGLTTQRVSATAAMLSFFGRYR